MTLPDSAVSAFDIRPLFRRPLSRERCHAHPRRRSAGRSSSRRRSVCDHIHWVKALSAPDEATRKIGFDGLAPEVARRRNELAGGDERIGPRGLPWLGDHRATRQPGGGRRNRARPGAADGQDFRFLRRGDAPRSDSQPQSVSKSWGKPSPECDGLTTCVGPFVNTLTFAAFPHRRFLPWSDAGR